MPEAEGVHMGDGSIRTQFDDILSALKSAGGKPVSVPALSSASGMPEKEILKWLHTLEKNGQVHIKNRLMGVSVSWVERSSKPMTDKSAMEANDRALFASNIRFEHGISIAREQEAQAKAHAGKPKHISPEPEPAQDAGPEAPRRHKVALESVDMQMAEVGEQLEKVESMIAVLHMQKKIAKQLRQKIAEKNAKEASLAGEKAKEEAKLAAAEAMGEAKRVEKEAKLAGEKAAKEAALAEKKARLEDRLAKAEAKKETMREAKKARLEDRLAEAEAKKEAMREAKKARLEAKEAKLAEAEAERETQPEPFILEAAEGQARGAEKEESPSSYSVIKPLAEAKAAARGRKEKIKKPEPIHIAGVSTQFSERLARQVQRIIRQNQEIDALRQEKEKLLAEHYHPMQRKLESEIETISDRVLRMEKNILGMQERASNLPNKVSAVEKLQISSIKAHGQMRRAYDEASALIEESSRELSEERERMEVLVEQSRQEIASHRAKTVELEQALSRISDLESESSDRVIEARAALSEQAERLASAEQHAQELGALKNEIAEGVSSIKREISTTKAVLTNIEKQMGQVRQVELYSQSLRQDYEQKMGDLGDYIKHGNEDFETLRESVEANFVRRYLKELRELTDSYGFEFDQARKVEGSIDERIAEEKGKLEELIAEGKRIAHLYELQSKEVQGAESFEQKGGKLADVQQLAEKRTQIEGMIAQIVGGRSTHQPRVASTPIKARKSMQPKAARQEKPKAANAKKVGILRAKAKRKAKAVKAPVKKAKKKKGKR